MAIINFIYFLELLSDMSRIHRDILIKNKYELLKYLSHLGENENFDSNQCFKALNSIDENYFICIGLINKEDQKEFCKNIFIILKTKWSDFTSSFC